MVTRGEQSSLPVPPRSTQ
ncbi:CRISPR-associated protein Cas5 [Cryobacterium sp. Hh38]